MAVTQWTGTLNPNEIFGGLLNMIISQQVFADNIKGTYSQLVDHFRVDGTLYGDTKLYYSTDVLRSQPWGNDAEATNLLALDRPAGPEVQAITLNVFRQIRLTVDNYLTKRAWSTEGAFSSFNAVMLGWIRDTKRVYDATLFNSYIGTAVADKATESISITLPTSTDAEAQNRLQATTIAEAVANLLTKLKDVSRDFNDYGNLRSYDTDEIIFVWNAEWLNKITKVDLPTIFHKDGLMDKFDEEYALPGRYFGNVNTSSGTTAATNTTIRSLYEVDYNTVAPNASTYNPALHIFAGDLLPGNQAYDANTTYTVDSSIVFKCMHKRSVPFMSAFEVGTSFFNPRSLTENHYLTFGHNTIQYLYNYPFITATATNAE